MSGGWEKCAAEEKPKQPHTHAHNSQKPAQPDQVTLAGERAAPAKKHTGSRTPFELCLPAHCVLSDIIRNSQSWKTLKSQEGKNRGRRGRSHA